MRKDIVNIVNRLAKEAAEKKDCIYLDLSLIDLYNAISDYCKELKSRPTSNKYSLDHGCLYINGKLIERFAPLPPKPVFDEYSYHIEGKILERNEVE